MAIYGFTDLDFSTGIHARDMNNRLDALYEWLKRERLRIGGWGIVEGFELSCDANNFVVNVGAGRMINQDGDEVFVPAKQFGAGELENRQITRTYTVDNDGMVLLEDYPYDPKTQRFITYNPPTVTTTLDSNNFQVMDQFGFYVPVVRIEGRKLYVNASEYKRQSITVTQRVANDRVDTIMLHKNGEYEYLWSIESPSPSHVDLADYDDTFCIAVVYWTITTEGINCDFFTNHRSYRKIFVDSTNTLYINGEIYKKPKYIYFEEPEEEDREINDLWYNTKDNTLYIWRYHDGEFGWTIVNDHSEIVIKERKIWYPDDNPEDLQTFKFEDQELNLRFVPNSNALDILIDNSPLMDDQYEEIIANEQNVSELKLSIEEYKGKLKDQEEKLEILNKDRRQLQGAIQVLRKDISDSKQLYPSLYTEGLDYDIKKSDLPNLRNLMTINEKVAKKLEELATLIEQINSVQLLIDTYTEQIDMMNSITDGTYVSTGMGFKLKRPLVHAGYVEVTVTHVVRMKPAKETFQRAAIFVTEGDITVSAGHNGVFQTRDEVTYAIGEDQLEVFLDGVKLSKWKHQLVELIDETLPPYKEYDYSASEDIRNQDRSKSSQHFGIKVPCTEGQTITYRISKHVWSYDQLDRLIANIRTFAQSALGKANTALETVTEIEENINVVLESIRSDIGTLKQEVRKIDQCFKKDQIIPYENMPERIKQNMVGAPINRWTSAALAVQQVNGITVDKQVNSVTEREEIVGGDIFFVHYITPTEQRLLVCEDPDIPEEYIDYWVDNTVDHTGVNLTLRDDLVSSEAYLYIVGFKRGMGD